MTPREVIQMMVQILYTPDKKTLSKEHAIKTIYDPACGTGGMLSVSKQFIQNSINKKADIYLYGQELNPVTYAIAKADMLIKGEDADKIKGGEKDHSKASTLSNDQFRESEFDYMLSNPPFGVDWKKDKEEVDKEAVRGFAGRFGAGTPRSSDGQLLFLQHMISKMRNKADGGSRIAIVFNGSPLFTGDAGSGESEIRRWILEGDLLEAIIALPDQLFYNTGISTYVWILTNRKEKERKEKVQLIDARTFFKKMRKSLGNKRHEISDEDQEHISKLYIEFKDSKHSKIFKTTDFAFRQITVERPLRLNFQVNEERIEQVRSQPKFSGPEIKPDEKESSKFKKLKKRAKAVEELEHFESIVIPILKKFDDKLYKNREEFLDVFDKKFKDEELKLPASLKKVVLAGISERDEEADICIDSKGNPEPDTDLRDTENVPYGQDIYEYFEREVKPYAPDAWIDESKKDHKDGLVGRVGYEIHVTRYFYQYEPPRAL